MTTKLHAVPVIYQGQQFPSQRALAKHLAPLIGRSVPAVHQLLRRHKGDVERVLRTKPRPNAPIVYQGQHFSSRRALAHHLAPLTSRSVSALKQALLRRKGDAEHVLNTTPRPEVLGLPIVYQGQRFPSQRALAQHLAPLAGMSVPAVRRRINLYGADLDRIIAGARRRPSRDDRPA